MAGKGLSTKWSSYYNTGGRKEKKTSSESLAREVQELRAQVARIPEIVQEQVQQQLRATITAIVPTLIEGLSAWIAGGQQGPPLIPSFTASNSQNTMAGPLVSPAEAALVSPTPARELNAPGCTLAAPLQQAAPPSTARPPLAVPRH